MGTRATYRIQEYNEGRIIVQYFYIHYDGYPTGAANYFIKMLKNFESLQDNERWRPGKAAIAFGMIPLSEFTIDHEVHGDTDYRYNVYFKMKSNPWDITAYGGNGCSISAAAFFDGPLDKFIEKYGVKN